MSSMHNIPKNQKLHKAQKILIVLVFLLGFTLAGASACRILEAPSELPVSAEPAPLSAPISAPARTRLSVPPSESEAEQTPEAEPTPEIIEVRAFRSDISILIDEIPVTLCLYGIGRQYYVNLFEFALILSDFNKHFFPEWVYFNNIVNVSSESAYTVEELTFSHRNPDITYATSINISVIIDGSEIFVPAYLIEDDVFFELNAVADVLDLVVDINFIDGVIDIFTIQALANRAARIKSLDPSRPMIALTFDDGPSATTTIEILDILEEYNVVATFFVLGSLAARHDEIVSRAFDLGCEIANHTWSHMSAADASEESLRSQLRRTGNEIESITGIPSTNFRPPFGHTNRNLQSVTGELGYPIILWSIDPSDYLPKSPDQIYDFIMERVQDRDIILLHDIHNRTVNATRLLVPSLIEQGFQFVTVSELFLFSGIKPEPGNIYRHAR